MNETLQLRLCRLVEAGEYLVACQVTAQDAEADRMRLKEAFEAISLAVEDVMAASAAELESLASSTSNEAVREIEPSRDPGQTRPDRYPET